jgi:hypothetical protein
VTDDEKVKETLTHRYGDTAPYRDAELELRIAWLRVHGQLMYAVDATGLLSAQLLDLADLLEILDAEGRWGS